jgi:predicted nucleic acid-binding Zn ribbon protein
MQKKCKYCGKEFDATKSKRLYCSDKCKKSRWREKDKKRKYGVHMENPNAAVVDMAVKAREAGMTYGQYVAKMGGTDHAEKQKKYKRELAAAKADIKRLLSEEHVPCEFCRYEARMDVPCTQGDKEWCRQNAVWKGVSNGREGRN